MPKIFILDIETRGDASLFDTYCSNIKPDPRLKDPDKIEADLNKKTEEAIYEMALDSDYSDIICVGVYDLYTNKKHIFTPQEFATWLTDLEDVIEEDMGRSKTKRYQSYRVATFNGRNFDLPILIKHGIRNGIAYPYEYMVQWCDKYKGTAHIDLMEKLSMVWGKNKSLDQYLQIYCGVAKTPIDFKEASEDEIKKHCSEDLDNTKLLFEKVNGKLFFNV